MDDLLPHFQSYATIYTGLFLCPFMKTRFLFASISINIYRYNKLLQKKIQHTKHKIQAVFYGGRNLENRHCCKHYSLH